MQDDQIGRDIALVWERLGPHPEDALCALVNLDLDDHEIGRYHAVSLAAVSALRKLHCVKKRMKKPARTSDWRNGQQCVSCRDSSHERRQLFFEAPRPELPSVKI